MRCKRGSKGDHVDARFGARRLPSVIIVGVFAAGALVLGAVAPASADATLTVCASGCQYTTIQDALGDATAGDTIKIGPGTYSGGVTIDKDLSLVGDKSEGTTISGGGPVVTVSAGASVTIKRVTISGGWSGGGAGVYNAGSLTLKSTTVSDNGTDSPSDPSQTGDGAGIYNTGTLELNQSTVTRNIAFASGGGIFNAGGTATLSRSTVSDNNAFSGSGGGISSSGGTVVLNDSTVTGNGGDPGGGIDNAGTMVLKKSTVSDNQAFTAGGGIANAGTGTLTLNRSAVIGNRAGFTGGGILNHQGGSVTLHHSTVTGNQAVDDGSGGGIYTYSPTVQIHRSAVTGNTPDDCFGC